MARIGPCTSEKVSDNRVSSFFFVESDQLAVVLHDREPEVFWKRNGSWERERVDPNDLPELTPRLAANATTLFGAHEGYSDERQTFVVGRVHGEWYTSFIDASPQSEQDTMVLSVNKTRWHPEYQQAVAWNGSIAMVRSMLYANQLIWPVTPSSYFETIEFGINDGNGWEVTELVRGHQAGTQASLAVSPDGHLWLAMYDDNETAFKIGRYDGSWEWQVMARGGDYRGFRDFGMIDGVFSLSVLAQDGVHVLRLIDGTWQDERIPGAAGHSGPPIVQIGGESFIIYTEAGDETYDVRAVTQREGNWTHYALAPAQVHQSIDALYWDETLYYLYTTIREDEDANYVMSCPVTFEEAPAQETPGPSIAGAGLLVAAGAGARALRRAPG